MSLSLPARTARCASIPSAGSTTCPCSVGSSCAAAAATAGAPISPRYPLVEAVTAGCSCCWPWRSFFPAASTCRRLAVDTAQLVGIYAFHLLLLCTLLAAALIQYDGQQPPVRLFCRQWSLDWRPRRFGPCCTRGRMDASTCRTAGRDGRRPRRTGGRGRLGPAARRSPRRRADCLGASPARACFSAGRRPARWPRDAAVHWRSGQAVARRRQWRRFGDRLVGVAALGWILAWTSV